MQKPQCGKPTAEIQNFQNLLCLPSCQVSQTGATFAENLTLEEWSAVGKKAVRVAEASRWIVGDWLVFGHRKFIESAIDGTSEHRHTSELFRVALEALPYETDTLRRTAWVCANVSAERRRPRLSFYHHEEVADLPPGEQERYLTLAEQNDWTRSELRVAIRRDKGETVDHKDLVPVQSFTQWTTRAAMVLSRENPDAWTTERRELAKRALQPLVEFYNRL